MAQPRIIRQDAGEQLDREMPTMLLDVARTLSDIVADKNGKTRDRISAAGTIAAIGKLRLSERIASIETKKQTEISFSSEKFAKHALRSGVVTASEIRGFEEDEEEDEDV